MDYNEAIYMLSKILRYYKNNSALPNYCAVTLWTIVNGTYKPVGEATFGNDFSGYGDYLVPTANCQSTNATIKAAAKTAMNYTGGSGCAVPATTYQAMWNMEKYVNPKLTYDGYYDTQQGALNTWNYKSGNCCDMAHLACAMARSLGVPARYQHGYCRFNSGLETGHVWAQVYCGSSKGWQIIDWVSGYSYLGYKNNTTLTFYNSYAALPF
jgi:transglutaminase-like putative cysteine protease